MGAQRLTHDERGKWAHYRPYIIGSVAMDEARQRFNALNHVHRRKFTKLPFDNVSLLWRQPDGGFIPILIETVHRIDQICEPSRIDEPAREKITRRLAEAGRDCFLVAFLNAETGEARDNYFFYFNDDGTYLHIYFGDEPGVMAPMLMTVTAFMIALRMPKTFVTETMQGYDNTENLWSGGGDAPIAVSLSFAARRRLQKRWREIRDDSAGLRDVAGFYRLNHHWIGKGEERRLMAYDEEVANYTARTRKEGYNEHRVRTVH